jgi:hypothetical protein
MTSSRQTLRELPCRVTVYGPTVPLGPADRAACVVQPLGRGNDPPGLYYQPAARGVRAYTLYNYADDARWMDPGSGSRVYLSPSLFVVDPEGATRAIPLASDRWAVSADGSRAAFAFGSYDDDDHEFTVAWGYVDCRVDVWDVSAAAKVTSTELETVPEAVAFAGENVLINCDEDGLRIPGPARVKQTPDRSDGRMALPGGGDARIPVFVPSANVVLPVAGGRLFVPEKLFRADWSQENVPIWLDDRGSAPVPATPGEWTGLMGVDMATIPLVWSPSAACFVTGPEEERRIVERGTGRTLHTPPSRFVHAITDDGARAVVTLEERRGDAVVESRAIVSRDGVAIPLQTGALSRFAFSRAGDRLFVSEDWTREGRSGTLARCYDAGTGEVLWETPLLTGYRDASGYAIWSGDDREVLVAVRPERLGRQGGLVALRRDDGKIRGRLTLGDFLPYPLAAPGDAIVVRAEGLFLAIR